MAPSHPSHLSLGSKPRPSIAIFLVIIISISAVPFLSLSSSELIPNLAYTLWDSLVGILTSSSFYFLLLNFLIVALICLSGVLDPSSKCFNELPDGENPQNGYYHAAHIINERLALDEFYGSQASSPRLIERSNVYVADEVQSSERGETSLSKLRLTKPIKKNVVFSASKMHSTNPSKIIELDVVEQAVINNSMMKNRIAVTDSTVDGHIANLDDEMISDADRNMNVKDMQVFDEDHHGDGEAHEEGGEGAINAEDCGSDDVPSADHDAKLNAYKGHDDDVDDGQIGDAFQEPDTTTQRVPQAHHLLLQMQMQQQLKSKEADEEANVGDKERIWDGIVDVRGEAKDVEEGAREVGAGGREGKTEEVEMMSMSREELNERASAFITAFRKKLISTTIVDGSPACARGP